MQKRFLMTGFMAVALSAAAVVACGDDDPPAAPGPTPQPDGGGDVTVPQNDGSTGATDSGADAATDPDSSTPADPVLADNTVRIANAINPYGLVWASDGLLYMSGALIDGADQKLAVWRFTAAGEIDTTFGTDGAITVDIAGAEASHDIAEVSPGNFVVQASAGGAIYLVKLTKDGGGAFAFGTPERVVFDWVDPTGWPGPGTPSYTSWGIGIDRSVADDPKVVVFANGAPAKVAQGETQRTDNDRWVARVKFSDLQADQSFNNGKAYTSDVDGLGLSDNARRGLVLPDGTILSTGYTNISGTNTVALIRLKPDGTPDAAYGANSTVTGQLKLNPFAPNGFAEAYNAVRQSNGRIVTTGYGRSNFDTPTIAVDMVLNGWKDDGVDPTFGRQGSFAVQSETDPAAGLGSGFGTDPAATIFRDRGRDLVVLSDDRIVVAGAYDEHAAIFVIDKDGGLDTGSGQSGRIVYGYPGNFFKIALSPDGKRIAASAESLNQTFDAGVLRGSVLATLKVGQ